MANTYTANVIYCDTNASIFPQAKSICGVKYIGASTSSVTLRGNASATGATLYYENASTNIMDPVEIRDNAGIYVGITGTAAVYIYLEE